MIARLIAERFPEETQNRVEAPEPKGSTHGPLSTWIPGPDIECKITGTPIRCAVIQLGPFFRGEGAGVIVSDDDRSGYLFSESVCIVSPVIGYIKLFL